MSQAGRLRGGFGEASRSTGATNTETALRRRVLKIETHRGRPVQEYDVRNRWFNLVDRSPVTDDKPFDD